jgi:hypothetical protein
MDERQRGSQRTPRYTRRLEAVFRSGGFEYRGILSNISENGLFIRTNRGFAPGSILEIELILPDNRVSKIKGVVRRTIKTPTAVSNGMGVELLEKDSRFLSFMKSVRLSNSGIPENDDDQFTFLYCGSCGAKNRIPREKVQGAPRCGKCRNPLHTP